MTSHKLRQLELAAGAPRRQGQLLVPGGNRSPAMREAEPDLARQAEVAYPRTIADWKAARPGKAWSPAWTIASKAWRATGSLSKTKIYRSNPRAGLRRPISAMS